MPLLATTLDVEDPLCLRSLKASTNHLLVDLSASLELRCQQPEKETKLDAVPVRDTTQQASKQIFSSREKAEDYPVS